jgi:O-antigen/teichoic acid export membrane protein
MSGDHHFRAQIISTAFAGLWGAAVIALGVVGMIVWLLPTWFPAIPQEGRHEARLALLLLGSSLAAGLPATVAAGIFSGFQRNEIPAFVSVGSRLAIAAALIFLATARVGLFAMAAAYAAINVAATVVQFALLKRWYPDLAFRITNVAARAGRELFDYCFSLTVWSVGILAVNGLDSVIAGRIDFHWAGYFAVAASIVTLIMGVQVAALQPLVAIAAQLHSSHEPGRLGELLIEATRANAALSLLSLVPIYVAGGPLLAWWIGTAFGAQLLPILQVVLIGIFVRQTIAPFAAIVLGTGEQRLIVATPIYEGIVKLAVSIGLGIAIGAIGVALGTIAGGIVCLLSNLLLNFPHVRGLLVDRRRFVMSGVLQPIVVFTPVLLVAAADAMLPEPAPLMWRTIATILTGVGTLAVGWPALRRLRALV